MTRGIFSELLKQYGQRLKKQSFLSHLQFLGYKICPLGSPCAELGWCLIKLAINGVGTDRESFKYFN